jgi:hypothetical protein
MASLPEVPDLEKIGWGYPSQLLGTRSQTRITITPLRFFEKHTAKDFRRTVYDATEEVTYEIALRKEDASSRYEQPEELEMLARHLQGWVETNSAAMKASKGFWMEYAGTEYPPPTKTNPKVFIVRVRLIFHSIAK